MSHCNPEASGRSASTNFSEAQELSLSEVYHNFIVPYPRQQLSYTSDLELNFHEMDTDCT